MTNNIHIRNNQVGNLVVRGEDRLFGLEGDPGREISRDTVRCDLVIW